MRWIQGVVLCAICDHKWVAVRPEETGNRLECPGCGYIGETICPND